MKKKLAKLRPAIEPQSLGEHDWYYAESRRLTLVHQVISEGRYIQTDQIEIPLRVLKRIAKRYGGKGAKAKG